MMNKSILVVALLFLLCGFNFLRTAWAKDADGVHHLSLVHILVAPEASVGKRISVVGYLSGETDPVLFLTEGHARQNDVVSGIPVYMVGQDFKLCLEKVVRVSGRLIEDSGGVFAVADVSNIWAVESRHLRPASCLVE